MIKHNIGLVAPDGCHIIYALHRARPKSRELENTKTDKMLHMNVIEPRQSECASPILMALEMSIRYEFVSNIEC